MHQSTVGLYNFLIGMHTLLVIKMVMTHEQNMSCSPELKMPPIPGAFSPLESKLKIFQGIALSRHFF